MSFKSKLTLDSNFFKPEARKQAFGSAVIQSANNFRRDLQQKMIESKPAGRVETIGRGTNFQARFQRSKRGQRPAIQSRRLLDSIRAKRVGELAAEVTVVAETDSGFNYGEYLQEKQDRQILTEADKKAAQTAYDRTLNQALISLI